MDRVKTRSLSLAILLGAVLMVPTQSFAQVYIGGYGGVTIPHEADFEESGFGLTFSGEFEYDPAVIAGARVGYWGVIEDLPWLGVEFDAYWTNPDIDQGKLFGISFPFDADLTLISGGFNGLIRYPYGPIQPYAGVGVGVVYAEFNSDEPGASFSDDDVASSLQLMAGVKGFVSDNLALFAEYKWVLTEFEFEENAFVTLDVDYNASNIYGGIEWHFGTGGVHQQP